MCVCVCISILLTHCGAGQLSASKPPPGEILPTPCPALDIASFSQSDGSQTLVDIAHSPPPFPFHSLFRPRMALRVVHMTLFSQVVSWKCQNVRVRRDLVDPLRLKDQRPQSSLAPCQGRLCECRLGVSQCFPGAQESNPHGHPDEGDQLLRSWHNSALCLASLPSNACPQPTSECAWCWWPSRKANPGSECWQGWVTLPLGEDCLCLNIIVKNKYLSRPF